MFAAALFALTLAQPRPDLRITGVVTDKEGRPIASAQVTAEEPGDRWSGPRDLTETDAAGRFGFIVLDSPRKRVSIGHPEYRPLELILEKGSRNVPIVLTRAGRVRGRVLTDERQPLQGYRAKGRRFDNVIGAFDVPFQATRIEGAKI